MLAPLLEKSARLAKQITRLERQIATPPPDADNDADSDAAAKGAAKTQGQEQQKQALHLRQHDDMLDGKIVQKR